MHRNIAATIRAHACKHARDLVPLFIESDVISLTYGSYVKLARTIYVRCA
jgi:hypothetical protein